MRRDPFRPTLVITGSAGFIGRALVLEAARAGFPVVAVSRRLHVAVPKGVTAMRVASYAELLPEPDSVLIHLAEPPSLSPSVGTGDCHLTAMTTTMTALLARSWRHVVYASSVVVYGDQSMDFHRPGEPVRPVNPYARGKIACETAVLNVGGTVLRLSNIVGPGVSPGTIFADVLAQLDCPGPLRVRNFGPERDYLWVYDAARGFLAAATQQRGGVFNLATGRVVSVTELLDRILSAVGQPKRLVEASAPPYRSRIAVDIADTIRLLGWRPQTSLEVALSRLVRRYQ